MTSFLFLTKLSFKLLNLLLSVIMIFQLAAWYFFTTNQWLKKFQLVLSFFLCLMKKNRKFLNYAKYFKHKSSFSLFQIIKVF